VNLVSLICWLNWWLVVVELGGEFDLVVEFEFELVGG
jgi:hypothetical protein